MQNGIVCLDLVEKNVGTPAILGRTLSEEQELNLLLILFPHVQCMNIIFFRYMYVYGWLTYFNSSTTNEPINTFSANLFFVNYANYEGTQIIPSWGPTKN
jgi:hypothetical protein